MLCATWGIIHALVVVKFTVIVNEFCNCFHQVFVFTKTLLLVLFSFLHIKIKRPY